jgi:hypothetical protein
MEKLHINVTPLIKKFAEFLCHSVPIVDDLMINHEWEDDSDLRDDWEHANWELLVERELFNNEHFLCSLSHQRDIRIIQANKIPDYVIVARKKRDEDPLGVLTKEPIPIKNGLRVIWFVSVYEGRGFGFYPPFDVIHLLNDKTKKNYYVKIDEVDFFAIPLDEYLNSL